MRSVPAIVVLGLLGVLGFQSSGLSLHLHMLSHYHGTPEVSGAPVGCRGHDSAHHAHHAHHEAPASPESDDEEDPWPGDEHDCDTCRFLLALSRLSHDATSRVVGVEAGVRAPAAHPAPAPVTSAAPRESAPRAPPVG